MRGNLHLAIVLAGLCTGCVYDGNDGYSRPNQVYGYAPEYVPSGEYYGYAPSYTPYEHAPPFYQPAPSVGLGFGVFGNGGHSEHEREEEWRAHHNGGEHSPGFEGGEGHIVGSINRRPL